MESNLDTALELQKQLKSPHSNFLGCPKFLGSSAVLSFKVDQANVESCV